MGWALFGLVAIVEVVNWFLPRVQYEIGRRYENRSGFSASQPDKAAKWYRLAGEPDRWFSRAYVPAQVRLGQLYATNRIGTPKERPLGMKWAEYAAGEGSPEAINTMGYYLDKGLADAQQRPDASGAFNFYRIAAEQGNPLGMCNLGTRYLTGVGVPQQFDLAYQWISTGAAKSQAPSCQYKLALLHENGWGTAQDSARAFAMYSQLQNTVFYPAATLHLVRMYSEGIGTKPDLVAARELLQRWRMNAGADLNEESSPVQTGDWAYQADSDSERIAQTERQFLVRWAQAGDAESQLRLAVLYEHDPLMQDEAPGLYRQAAEQGKAEAQAWLGHQHQLGELLPRNLTLASQWLQRAANQCQPSAQHELGRLLAAGTGMPKNEPLAYQWLSLAVSNGQTQAIAERDALLDRLTVAGVTQFQHSIQEGVTGMRKNGVCRA